MSVHPIASYFIQTKKKKMHNERVLYRILLWLDCLLFAFQIELFILFSLSFARSLQFPFFCINMIYFQLDSDNHVCQSSNHFDSNKATRRKSENILFVNIKIKCINEIMCIRHVSIRPGRQCTMYNLFI